MFYYPIKIKNALSCKNCQEQLVEPKILPCGKTVCSLCASKIKVNRNEFDCLVCKKTNHAVSGLLSLKLTSAYDLLEESLDNIQIWY
jgi:hypothetical protein